VMDCSDRILSGHPRDLISLAEDESTRHAWHWDQKLDLNFLSWYKQMRSMSLAMYWYSTSTNY
jgi:hypothetical protein